MRVYLRLCLASAVLAAGLIANVAPALAAGETITVTCSNGFSRTVAAQAARGVATSLTKFNEHSRSGVTCAAAPGAPRPRPAAAWQTITCTNGFERNVNARAAGAILKALNAYNTRRDTGVTCAAA